MDIRHLQLNTSTQKSPNEIINFMGENRIDIACFQEICFPIGTENPLKPGLEQKGYNYIDGIHFHLLPKNQSVGVAIASKWPIIDYHCVYYNTPDYNPKEIKEHDLFGEVLNDNPNDHFSGSRGLKHSIKSRCIISADVQTEAGVVRVMTTHYTVSDLCTETVQMFEMSQIINSLVKYSKDIPTIFSADLNIRAQSYSVTLIKEVLACHTEGLTDTLSSTHIAKKTDFPNGLAIDHVFSKNLKYNSTSTVEVSFSEHKALISEFSLNSKTDY